MHFLGKQYRRKVEYELENMWFFSWACGFSEDMWLFHGDLWLFSWAIRHAKELNSNTNSAPFIRFLASHTVWAYRLSGWHRKSQHLEISPLHRTITDTLEVANFVDNNKSPWAQDNVETFPIISLHLESWKCWRDSSCTHLVKLKLVLWHALKTIWCNFACVQRHPLVSFESNNLQSALWRFISDRANAQSELSLHWTYRYGFHFLRFSG